MSAAKNGRVEPTCGRVSCSHGSAIHLCNIDPNPIAPSCDAVANVAVPLLLQCVEVSLCLLIPIMS